MKKLLSLGALFLLIGMTAGLGGQERVGSEGIRDRFVGAWRLAWLEEQGADGKVQSGRLYRPARLHARWPHVGAGMDRNPPGDSQAGATGPRRLFSASVSPSQ
jgi:hypothetical protein